MRKIIRTLLLLLVFAAIFPFTFPWKDGKPMLSWSDITMPTMPKVELPKVSAISEPQQEGEKEGPDRAAHQAVKLYQWTGADGSMNFSNEPPPAGLAYKLIDVHPDANLIQALPTITAEESGSNTEGDGPANGAMPPSLLTVSPGEAMQLMEQAQELKQLSEERLQQHEALMR